MTTPHNHAKPGDYAEAVLLPGDPLRAKWIAETFFENPKLVNSVRNCLGYTGTWKGKPVSVQASGMGQPSLAIYVHELINVYGLKTLIRVGTCGGLNTKVKVRDLVLAQAASTDSAIVRDRFEPVGTFGNLDREVGRGPRGGQIGPCRHQPHRIARLPARRDVRKNRVARVLLNFFLTSLGTAIGVWTGGATILGKLLG